MPSTRGDTRVEAARRALNTCTACAPPVAVIATKPAWLEGEHPSWIPKLERGLVEAFELLVTFPRAGAAVPPEPMRKLVLHKLPFVIWYVFDEAEERVLLRLFLARQRRAR